MAIRVEPELAERAGAAMLELAPAGLEEVASDDAVELIAYVDADGATELVARFPAAVVTPLEEGWEDAWRAFHRPALAGGLWLGPPWLDPPPGVPAVVVDPGRAFGTGAHPTTRLCVELLASGARGSLLDVGCGSGVLSVAAARLGYAPIVAVDVDPVAVETAVRTAEANGVVLDAHVADAEREPLPACDVAVANVLLAPVERILARLQASVGITSGYLAGERPVHDGWEHVAHAELEGWAADRFRRVG